MSDIGGKIGSAPVTAPGWTAKSEEVIYDEARIYGRSRLIALGIDARQQRFPDEPRYVYQPLIGEEDANRWNEDTRESVLKNYNQRDLGL